MSLRRRFGLLFAAYFLIIAIAGGLVWFNTRERDDQIARQRALAADSPLSARERVELSSIEHRLDDLRWQLDATVAGAVGAALLTTLVAVWLTRRWVTRPLDQVTTAVRAVRSGEIGVVAPYGPAEIANVARDVDEMRKSMNRALYDAVRARETIEQSASVVLTLRSELASDVEELPEGWTVAAQLQPAEGVVAGDCYDVIDLRERRLGLVVVDISGHGAMPGILALRCKELLRAGLRNGLAPGQSVEWAAGQLDDLDDETFLSAFVAVVDLDSGRVRYANAGHPPPLLCAPHMPLELPSTGPIVGFVDQGWRTDEATIQRGDTLAIYTDGLVEVRDAARREYGVGRLTNLLSASSSDEADVIAKRCVDEVSRFAPGRLIDDVTVVLLCRGPRADRVYSRFERS